MSASTEIRILLLEDNPHDAALLVAHLRHSGYDPRWRCVDTASALRAALADGLWDLVLADYSMPQFTALDALTILKEHHLDVPFIIVSGNVGEPAAVEAMKAGAHDFFLKDNLARLTAAVERERGEAVLRQERREAIHELRESQERLRQAVHARDEFLSIASHELKTPLTTLSLQIETAQRLLEEAESGAVPTEKLKVKLTRASRQIVRLTSLVNHLLEVTRISSGRMALSPEVFDLGEAVGSAVADLQEIIRSSSSRVTVQASMRVEGLWDRHGIDSVILNLLSNAIKYGEGKPVEIEVDRDHDKARLIITDHGMGIAPSDQERIFHRFESAVPRTHFGGFGLGLWVVRQIIEAHQGTITLASKPGVGSIFTVLVPFGHEEGRG